MLQPRRSDALRRGTRATSVEFHEPSWRLFASPRSTARPRQSRLRSATSTRPGPRRARRRRTATAGAGEPVHALAELFSTYGEDAVAKSSKACLRACATAILAGAGKQFILFIGPADRATPVFQRCGD